MYKKRIFKEKKTIYNLNFSINSCQYFYKFYILAFNIIEFLMMYHNITYGF